MTFRVGQRVVCVKAGQWQWRIPPGFIGTLPVQGGVYTIRCIHDNPSSGKCFLGLEELNSDAVWETIAFRPVKTSETGMAVLTRLLLPGPARRHVREPAAPVSRRFERSAR